MTIVCWQMILMKYHTLFLSKNLSSAAVVIGALWVNILCKQFGPRSGLPIWIQTVWHSDSIAEIFFRKNWLWKKSADDQKAWTISQ